MAGGRNAGVSSQSFVGWVMWVWEGQVVERSGVGGPMMFRRERHGCAGVVVTNPEQGERASEGGREKEGSLDLPGNKAATTGQAMATTDGGKRASWLPAERRG